MVIDISRNSVRYMLIKLMAFTRTIRKDEDEDRDEVEKDNDDDFAGDDASHGIHDDDDDE